MKKIAILIDFTSICKTSCLFGSKIAEKLEAGVTLVNICASQLDEKESLQKLKDLKILFDEKIELEYFVESGSFTNVIPNVILNLEADLVVIGTHGKVGIKQNLFGSNVLHLVKSLSKPCLVVQQESVYSDQVFKNLLFPVAPHEYFEIKIKQVSELAIAFNSQVNIINITKDIRGIPENIRTNLKKSVDYFNQNSIQHKEVQQDANEFSIGYAKAIIKHAVENNMGCICIMTKVSKDNYYFGNVDKENILLNHAAIPVFCANDDNL